MSKREIRVTLPEAEHNHDGTMCYVDDCGIQVDATGGSMFPPVIRYDGTVVTAAWCRWVGTALLAAADAADRSEA
jgi:hypothetical protein